MNGPLKRVMVPAKRWMEQTQEVREAVRQADFVVDDTGYVIKNRDEVPGRQATDEEKRGLVVIK